MITDPGFYPEMDAATYHADPAPQPSLNQHGIPPLLDLSPRHFAYQHPRLNPYRRPSLTTSKGKLLGETAHAIALGKGREISVIRYNDYSSSSARSDRDLALSNGRVPVLESLYLQAMNLAPVIVAAIEEACEGHEYQTELPMFWAEETEFGTVWLRGMMDVFCPALGIILDPKCLRTPSIPGAFGKAAGDYGFDLQARYYCRGVERLLPEMAGRVKFYNLAIETFEPHGHALFEPDGESAAAADMDITLAISRFAECLARRSWPTYPRAPQRYSTPHYRQQRSLERSIAFFGDA